MDLIQLLRRSGPNKTANARLIATAPDLLAAIKLLPLEVFEDESNIDAAQFVDESNAFMEAMRAARIAINKSEGK